jgi:hypothetical protein
MNRSRTKRTRAKVRRFFAAVPSARPLFTTTDHGDPIAIHRKDIGSSQDNWVEPFLIANKLAFQRLALRPEVTIDSEPCVILRPGHCIGALPLLNPSSRRVAAGLLVEPRFQWPSLGAVFSAIGFSVEPLLGGAPLVPGSARKVPPWLLAGPVIERIAAMLKHRKRGFVERKMDRSSPRGRIDWNNWASANLPSGKWTSFPCHFSEPDDDPELMAAVRWTLRRLEDELSTVSWTLPARFLLKRATEIYAAIGQGLVRRPSTNNWSLPGSSEWVNAAIEAMGWVAEERGLGGARSLDGLAWNLSVEEVWEAWVSRFSASLARQLGMVASQYQGARRHLKWIGHVHSMGALIPDVELRSMDRTIWIDAKYKAHLELLSQRGWQGLSDAVRDEHRADLHQALAYASLADAPHVDTLLVYPQVSDDYRPISTLASVTSGRRRVRIFLANLPFGFRNPNQQEGYLRSFREMLMA